MKLALRLCMGMLLGVTCSPASEVQGQGQGQGQERGYWRAASKTATSITGDVTLSESKLTISFSSFPIAQIRALKPAEISAAFDGQSGSEGVGNLYRLSIPSDKQFRRHNTLCGAEDTQWMVTYAAGRTLQIAFFSSATMPLLTPEAVATSTTLCGTYTYVR